MRKGFARLESEIIEMLGFYLRAAERADDIGARDYRAPDLPMRVPKLRARSPNAIAAFSSVAGRQTRQCRGRP